MEIPIEVRWLAYERRLSAIHEAGHLVIARSFGIFCTGEIYPTFTNDPRLRTWSGRTRFYAANDKPLKLKPGKRTGRLIEPSRQDMRMVSVAGPIAEAYWRDREVYRDVEPEIDWHDPDVMSETDWEGTGCPAGEPNKRLLTAADKVAALLMPDGGPLWPKLLWIARDLIENSRDIVGDDDLTVSRWISEVATANSGAAELTAG
jgi:hypothetical protein